MKARTKGAVVAARHMCIDSGEVCVMVEPLLTGSAFPLLHLLLPQ